MISSEVLFDYVSHDFYCAVPRIALVAQLLHHGWSVALNHNNEQALYKCVKVLSDELRANLFVEDILLLIFFLVISSRFFGHYHSLDIFKTLLDILALL